MVHKSSSHSSHIHWLSVFLAYSTLFLFGLADNIRGPLYPDVLKDLALTDTEGAFIWAFSSGFGFVGSAFAPKMMKSTGLLGSLRAALIFMMVGQLGMALSPSLLYALLSAISFGLSLGLLGVVQNLLVLQAGPPHEIQRLQAGLHSNYAGASLLAPLFLSGLMFFYPDWRAGYFGAASLTLLSLVALLRVRPGELEAHHQAKAHHPEKGRFPRYHVAWVGSVIGFYVMMEIIVSSRLALFLRREAGFDFTSASLATTMFFVGLFAGRVLFIFWRPALRLKTQMMASLLGTFLLMVMGLALDPRWMILTGFTMAPFYPLSMAYLGEKFPKHIGHAMSLVVALNGCFVVLMHLGVGSLSENWGINQALRVGPIAAIAALVFLFSDSLFEKKKLI